MNCLGRVRWLRRRRSRRNAAFRVWNWRLSRFSAISVRQRSARAFWQRSRPCARRVLNLPDSTGYWRNRAAFISRRRTRISGRNPGIICVACSMLRENWAAEISFSVRQSREALFPARRANRPGKSWRRNWRRSRLSPPSVIRRFCLKRSRATRLTSSIC